MSKIEVDTIDTQASTTLQVGDTNTATINLGKTGDAIIVPAGTTTTQSGATNVPSGGTVSIQTGGTLTIDAGATITNNGTASGFSADLTNLSATNLTSGTVPDARFPATLPVISGANLTNLNFTSVNNDIATLALHQATNNNSSRYNLVNSNVDVYQDSTAIANLTNVARDTTGEFMSTAIASGATAQAITGLTVAGGNIVRTSPESTAITNSEDGDGQTQLAYTTSSSVSGYVTADLGAAYTIVQMDLGKKRAAGDPRSILMSYSTDDASYPVMDLTSATSTVVSFTGESKNLSNFTSSGTADWAALTVNDYDSICRVTDFATFSARYLRYKFGSADFHDANAAWSQFKIYKQGITTGASGSYESTAQTANASTSIVSAVLTYTDNVGTTALNTDLVLEVSADNGVTFTSAPLTAAGSFSSGILQATTSDITVVAGTQIKYKVTFANQAALTKVTQVNGVSLIY